LISRGRNSGTSSESFSGRRPYLTRKRSTASPARAARKRAQKSVPYPPNRINAMGVTMVTPTAESSGTLPRLKSLLSRFEGPQVQFRRLLRRSRLRGRRFPFRGENAGFSQRLQTHLHLIAERNPVRNIKAAQSHEDPREHALEPERKLSGASGSGTHGKPESFLKIRRISSAAESGLSTKRGDAGRRRLASQTDILRKPMERGLPPQILSVGRPRTCFSFTFFPPGIFFFSGLLNRIGPILIFTPRSISLIRF